MPQSHQLSQIRQQISQHFDDEELRDLSFDLGFDYDDLGGRSKTDKARELVARMDRHGRLPDLLAAIKTARPHISAISALLPPHHIPFHPNQLFTGRETWLAQLHQALTRAGTAAITQAVAGLGGVGKTQLALAYCYRHLDSYDLIHWLRADDATTLAAEIAGLAYRLGLAPRTVTDQEQLRQLALDWLHTTDHRWLLIFDNADTIHPAELRPYLPKVGSGASLITSRNPNWDGLAQTLHLNLFSKTEAVAFLLNRPDLAGTNEADLAAWPEALRLAGLLGYLPLALEHARAYIAATGASLADYAGYFETERRELWEDVEAPPAYDQRTITTTWELAFSQVRQTPGAAALLNLCCFLAAEEIPLTLISKTAAAFDDQLLPAELVTLAQSKRHLDKAIAALRRYSLLTRQDNHLTLHRLVQTVAHDQMPAETAQIWLAVAVNLLNQAWPFDQHNMATWSDSASLLPHLLAVITAATQQKLETPAAASLNGKAGFYLRYTGNATAAKPFYEQALALAEKNFEPDHTNIALRLNNLGQLLQDLGDFAAARPYMERALAISEKALGPDHPTVATRLNNLGALLQDLGDFAAARPYMERALAISEKALGPDHPTVATRLNNLGALLQALGDFAAARPFLERALAISEKALGPDHPTVAIRLNNLGQLLKALGDFPAARSLMERALAIDEAALGPDHPDVAIDLNNLGQLLQDLGDFPAARPLMERALAIDEAALGPDHPDVAIDLNNLGTLLQDLGDFAAARPLMERALAISEAALGPDHPVVAIRLNNLGRLLQALGDVAAARPFLERALQIKEKSLGPDHPSTILGRDNLAILLEEIENNSP